MERYGVFLTSLLRIAPVLCPFVERIAVLTGIFKYAQTEDELGGILGHEMAHNLARHHGERVSSTFVVGMIARLSLLFDPSGGLLLIFMPAAQLLSELPNSRTQETEADRIGIRLAAEACFDPEALIPVFRRMEQAGSDGSDMALALKPPEFLSTHPSDDRRIKQMQKWLPEGKKIFHQEEGERCRRMRREIALSNRMMLADSANKGANDGLPPRG
jgi:metalloendopeptidase OMA1, mitochondrial